MTGNAMIEAPGERRGDGEALRSLARLAKDPGFSVSKALAQLPEGAARSIRPAIDRYLQSLQPLKALEPDGTGAQTNLLLAAFAPIGCAMRPDMTDDRADDWANAILLKLSDLPPFCIKAALDEALHVVWQFPTDLEAGLREKAERALERHRQAIRNLRAMLDEIHRAANPPAPQLESPEEGEPMSLDELRKVYRSAMGASLISLGLGCGAIRPEDLELVKAEAKAQAE